ncbi:MAG: methionyl-tRNA formyltransferase [Spirochaetota bacterium]
MTQTRIVFWGSPGIAATFLAHMVQNHADRFVVTACVTQTEKTIQRQGKTTTRSAVHEKALSLGIPVFTPRSVKKEAELLLGELDAIGYDLFVVLAYGKILPDSIIHAPRLKSVNFHGSLLPLLRGASPIEHALLFGFHETGWTLQRIVPALDAGDIIAQSRVAIDNAETTGTLYGKMTEDLLQCGPAMLTAYVNGTAQIIPQDHSAATHCGKISAEDGRLDFTQRAAQILNRYRAFTPRPGVFAFLRDKKLKLAFDLQAEPVSAGQAPGTLLVPAKGTLLVVCGDGQALRIASVTPEGKKPMPVADFINGYRILGGDERLLGAASHHASP